MDIKEFLYENKNDALKKAKKFIDLFPDLEYNQYLKWINKKGYNKITKKEFEREKEKME